MKRPKRSSTACSLRLCVENVVNSFATIHPEHRASTQKSNRTIPGTKNRTVWSKNNVSTVFIIFVNLQMWCQTSSGLEVSALISTLLWLSSTPSHQSEMSFVPEEGAKEQGHPCPGLLNDLTPRLQKRGSGCGALQARQKMISFTSNVPPETCCQDISEFTNAMKLPGHIW